MFGVSPSTSLLWVSFPPVPEQRLRGELEQSFPDRHRAAKDDVNVILIVVGLLVAAPRGKLNARVGWTKSPNKPPPVVAGAPSVPATGGEIMNPCVGLTQVLAA